MKKYQVILHPDAEVDLSSSFEWGRGAWGEKKARRWLWEMRRALTTRLASVPRSCAVAPESEELGATVRHLIVGRYRILFIIEKRTVKVLHVRGAHVPQITETT